MEDTVVPFEFGRMMFGTDPALFYLEIVFRTCVIYAYALLLIRWVGGRGIAQMSTVEFLLVIALGSAIGDAMFYPEVPIFHAMLVITVVVVINKMLDWLIARFKPVEKAIDGVTAEVVKDGIIVVKALRHANIGKSELFTSLREQGYANLGEVRQAYIETSGRFSAFRAKPPRYGLPIEPAWDVEPPVMRGSGTTIGPGEAVACCNCGTVLYGATKTPECCLHCHGTAWTTAVMPQESAT